MFNDLSIFLSIHIMRSLEFSSIKWFCLHYLMPVFLQLVRRLEGQEESVSGDEAAATTPKKIFQLVTEVLIILTYCVLDPLLAFGWYLAVNRAFSKLGISSTSFLILDLSNLFNFHYDLFTILSIMLSLFVRQSKPCQVFQYLNWL